VKINGQWIVNLVMSCFIILVMSTAIYALFISKITIGWKIFFIAIASLIIVWSFAMIYWEIQGGKAYYNIISIPIETFTEIRQYENCIIFSYKETAWHYTYQITKLAQLKEIKAIEYYKKNKDFLGWTLAPYSTSVEKQLKEQKEKESNAPVAQR
jgi:hypothetical protein